MASFTQTRRAERMIYNPEDTILDDRTYNMALGGSVMYGLILNIVMCLTLGKTLTDTMEANPIYAIYLFVGYIVCSIVGVLMSSKSKSPVISFIGYNLVVVPIGLVLSLMINAYIQGGAGDIVVQAIVYTAVITGCMIVLSIAFPNFFSGLGKLLLGCLIGLIIAGLLSMFLFPITTQKSSVKSLMPSEKRRGCLCPTGR